MSYRNESVIGLFGESYLKADVDEVIVTECVLDALAVYQDTGKAVLSLPSGNSMLPQEVRIWRFRFARWTNLGRLNDTLSRVCMHQLCHPLVLPILHHARDLTAIVVTTQCLMFYHRRSRPLCKSKTHYWWR